VVQMKRTRASSVGAASLAHHVGRMRQVSVHVPELLGPRAGVPPRATQGEPRLCIRNLPGMVLLVLGAIIEILPLAIIVEGFVLVARLTDIDPPIADAGFLREGTATDRGVVTLPAAAPHTITIALMIIAPPRAVISTVGQNMSIIAAITGLLVVIMEDVLIMDRTVGLVLTLRIISPEVIIELGQFHADDSAHGALPLHTRVVIQRLRIILSDAAPVLASLIQAVPKRSLENPIPVVLIPRHISENLIPTIAVLRRIQETPCALALTSQTWIFANPPMVIFT